jgi:hypothetical protein
MGCCSSVPTAGVDDKQMERIVVATPPALAPYLPKWSIAYTACLVKVDEAFESKQSERSIADLEAKQLGKLNQQAIDLADDPEFDAAAVQPTDNEYLDYDPTLKESIQAAAEKASQEAKENIDNKIKGVTKPAEVKVTYTLDDAADKLASSLTEIRTEMLTAMGTNSAIAQKAVEITLKTVCKQVILRMLLKLGDLHIQQWNKFKAEGKNPKLLFKKGQELIEKAQKDPKGFMSEMKEQKSGAAPVNDAEVEAVKEQEKPIDQNVVQENNNSNAERVEA